MSFTPVHANTKNRVKRAWRTQIVLRALALLGAIGAVFCIITIRNTSTAVSWIIRVGPGVALLHSLYATYFLARGHKNRPPQSCASYQIFAGLLDTGLLPFFALSCYMATLDFTTNAYGWDTIFNENIIDYKIIQTFMILCGVEGFILLLSLFVDVYLAVTYRKIAQLPPDMNPLDEKKDNLTGAGRSHKRNKSELLHEKHLSGSTLASERFSQIMSPEVNGRRVPFKHTRTDSADSDSTFVVKSVVRDESNDRMKELSRPSSAVMPAANARPAGVGLEHKPARSSGLARTSTPTHPNSWLSYSDYEGVPAPLSEYAQRELDKEIRSMSPVSALSDHETYPVYNSPPKTPRHIAPYPDQENMPSPTDLSLALPPGFTPKKRSREPLGMNPPTPVNQRFSPGKLNDADLVPRPLSTTSTLQEPHTPQRQALRETEPNSAMYGTPSSRPASFVGSGTKSRFYGNLRNSVGGSPTRGAEDDMTRSDTVRTSDSDNFEVYGNDSDDDYDPYRAHHAPPMVVNQPSPARQWHTPRQISNTTGNDLHAGYAGLDPEFGKGMARRREVSGKVAEEGRAYETTQVVDNSKPGAAGWARFKGL